MDQLKDFLEKQVGDKTVYDFAFALALFVGLFVAFRLFKTVVVKRLDKLAGRTKNDFDDSMIDLIEGISGLFYFVLALYFPLMQLVTNATAEKWIGGIFIVMMVYEAIKFLEGLIGYGLKNMAKRKGDEDATAFHGMKLVIKIILWATGLLLVLSNLGFDITSLVASLGIGGIAVALAVQNILGDIFSSFSIYFDKPFKVGDFIVVGENKGTVKKIGLKTTRLEALEGEEVIISNKELTSSRVQNFKKMRKRRVVFNIGVTYDTPSKKLKEIDDEVKKIVDKVGGVTFDRCRFFEFGDFSLNFEVVYYVDSGDYAVYMEKQEQINFAIKETFDREKIEIAFPTQTLYVNKG